MKIYTEENVIELINALKSIKLMLTAHPDYQHDIEFEDRVIQIDEVLEQITPIELPTDEDIKNEADSFYSLESYNLTFERGAKYVINKILNK